MDQNELSDVWLLPEVDTGSQSNISVDLSCIYPCIYLFSLSNGKKTAYLSESRNAEL